MSMETSIDVNGHKRQREQDIKDLPDAHSISQEAPEPRTLMKKNILRAHSMNVLIEK
jgi:hypothetical protein